MPIDTFPLMLIKHRGFFDYSKLLQAIRKWFLDEDFEVFNIKMHKQKTITPMGPEHEFKTHAEKTVTEYVRFHIDIFIRLYNIRDVELIQDGQKLKMQDAQIQIEITPKLELDWQKRFGGSKFLESLDKFFRSYIIKYKIGDYWEDMLLMKTGQLSHAIKQALGHEVI